MHIDTRVEVINTEYSLTDTNDIIVINIIIQVKSVIQNIAKYACTGYIWLIKH